MTRFFFSIIVLFVQLPTNAQTRLNVSLKKELDSLQVLDQKYRRALNANMRGKGDSLAMVYGVKKEDLNDYLWKVQGEIDSLNTVRVEEIINKHGYPGVSLVGKPTNEVAFYVIQHSKVIELISKMVLLLIFNGSLKLQLY